jgi:ABC-2 type transport system ATP-binding protein
MEMKFVASGGNGSADIPSLLRRMGELGIAFKDLSTQQSSLEDIFVSLVGDRARVTS